MDTSALQQRNLSSKFTYLLLGAVLLAGLGLRTWNVNFDGGLNAHPDERSTTCFYAPSIGWPSSVDEFLDPRQSPLNPLWDRQNSRRRSFTYGHFPLYLGILTGELLNDLAKPASLLPLPDRTVTSLQRANTPCDGVAFAGRLMMALLDTLTIFLLFLLGRRIFGAPAGLLAATLYSFTAQAIQLSHFFAMDPASTTFVTLSVYGGALMVQDRSRRGVFLAGVGAGLAVAAKFSALPILGVPLTAAVIVWWSNRDRSGMQSGERGDDLPLWSPFIALLLAFAAFVVTSPYAVLDWANFIQATLIEQGQMVRGIADLPFTRQYRNTIPYLYFVQQQVIWGMGLPLGLVALAGSAWALARAFLLRAKAEELIVWAWLVPYFGITGAFLAKFNRYMSPMLPFVLLFAAGLIVWLWQLGGRRRLRLVTRYPSAVLALVAVGGGLFWSLAYVNGVYGQEHTWISASRWVYAEAPPGSVILWELWDDALPKSIPGEPGMDMGSHGLRHIDWSPYEEDTAEKQEILRQKLQEADYVIYSSKRIYESVDELPERYPMTILYYDLMFSGQLGFVRAAEFRSPPRLLGFAFLDQAADESWSLYDHPQVTIFAKERELSSSEFDALLGGSWEGAVAWHRGREPPLSPILEAVGLGSSPESQDSGLLNVVLAVLQGKELPASGGQDGMAEAGESGPSLLLETPLSELPLVDNYRWNAFASERPWLAAGWWWLVVSMLGWTAWPLSFALFRGLRDRGYLLSKTLGWLVSGWLLWLLASLGIAHNTVRNAWLVVAVMALVNAGVLIFVWRELRAFLRRMGGIFVFGELLFGAAFVLFVFIRRGNPDIWQPWLGGEKFMEFAFLNGILRSPTFPPVDPHFAGGYINYYYYGIYLVGYLVKLTGIYAEVAFNLAIPTLFALTVLNAFAVAYSAAGKDWSLTRRGRGQKNVERPPVQPRPENGLKDSFPATGAEDLSTPPGGGQFGAILQEEKWKQEQKESPLEDEEGWQEERRQGQQEPHLGEEERRDEEGWQEAGWQEERWQEPHLGEEERRDEEGWQEAGWQEERWQEPHLGEEERRDEEGWQEERWQEQQEPHLGEEERWDEAGWQEQQEPHLGEEERRDEEGWQEAGWQEEGWQEQQEPHLGEEERWDEAGWQEERWQEPHLGEEERRDEEGWQEQQEPHFEDEERWQEQQEPLEGSNYASQGPARQDLHSGAGFSPTEFANREGDTEAILPPQADEPAPAAVVSPLAQQRWHEGIGAALLAPLFVAVLGNLAAFGQAWNALGSISQAGFESDIPGLESAVRSASGLWRVVTRDVPPPSFDFWAPSRVIPHTINEFPFWSFTFADLHPHMIGIPFALFFLGLTLTLLKSADLDWRRNKLYGALLLCGLSLTLGVLVVVNLWELPTYFGLGILTLAVTIHRRVGRLLLVPIMVLGALQLAGAYLFFLPFFRNYTNVAASGVGFVRAPDELGHLAQIWGFFAFVLFSWLLVERVGVGRIRFLRVHRLLVRQPSIGYFTDAYVQPFLILASALLLIFTNQTVLAVCLPALGLSLSVIWRRDRATGSGTICAALLTATGLALLAGTQVFYLKDFLNGGDSYRMNTLFKFFNHVWVLWGVAAAIVLPGLFERIGNQDGMRLRGGVDGDSLWLRFRSIFSHTRLKMGGNIWGMATLFLLAASLAYPLLGTPDRLSRRFPGWQPPIGTLDGMAYMENGVYYWPDSDNAIALQHDWEAIQWLLAHVRGNVVIAESAQVDYYRAGGTRVASLTGLSGLLGMHEGEQRYSKDVGERHGLLSEFWRTEDLGRVQQLIDELNIGLIYVGQLERFQHPSAPERLEQMERPGLLEKIFQNEQVIIYAVPSQTQGLIVGR